MFAEHERSDPELILEYKNGRKEAGEELVRRYYPRVFRLCCKYIHSQDDAQDVAQEVFLTIMAKRKIFSFRGEAKLWTWICCVTLNNCRKYWRRQKTQACEVKPDWSEVAGGEYLADPDALTPEDCAAQNEARAAVRQGLQQLASRYQEAILLIYWQDQSYLDAAQRLKIPLSTLGIWVMRGKRQLAQLFESGNTRKKNRPSIYRKYPLACSLEIV